MNGKEAAAYWLEFHGSKAWVPTAYLLEPICSMYGDEAIKEAIRLRNPTLSPSTIMAELQRKLTLTLALYVEPAVPKVKKVWTEEEQAEMIRQLDALRPKPPQPTPEPEMTDIEKALAYFDWQCEQTLRSLNADGEK